MATKKKSSHALSASCLMGLAAWSSVVNADNTSVGLLNPSLTPQQQGWLIGGNYPVWDVTANEAFITANTIGVTLPPNYPRVQLFYRPVPILVEEGYSVDLWLKVNDAPMPHIAPEPPYVPVSSVAFYPSTTTARLVHRGYPPQQAIYFDEDGIGWGDESDMFAMDTTDNFHHYRIEVAGNGDVQVLVDGEPALQRTGLKIYPRVAFGDIADVEGMDSRYSISSLTVTGEITKFVPIDARPGYCPNPSIDGRISSLYYPIAIVATPDFDPRQIDPASIRINGIAPDAWSIRDASRPYSPYMGKEFPEDCSPAGADGRKDLVVAYYQRRLATALGTEYAGPTLRLTGRLKPEFGGTAFAGEDVVSVHSVQAP